MRAEIFAGGWYCDALPNGEYVVLFPEKELLTHNGPVPLPTQNVLFPRCAPGRFAGVGHKDDFAWEYTHGLGPGEGWRALTPASGVSPVAYDNNGKLLINDGSLGSQGIRYIDESNRIVTGDATYQSVELGLHEYTTLEGITVGMDSATDEAIILYQGARRKLSDKRCRFIRFEKWGSSCSVAIWREGYLDALIVWFEVSEIAQFPLIAQDPTGSPLEVLETIRKRYPTPLGDQHAAFLLEAARALRMGLLRKTGGTRIMLPDGVEVSQDILMDPSNGRIYDILGDGEGAAIPSWGEALGSPQPLSRLYVVTAAPPVDPPVDPPTDPPVDPPGPIVSERELILLLGTHLGAW